MQRMYDLVVMAVMPSQRKTKLLATVLGLLALSMILNGTGAHLAHPAQF